MGANVLYKDTDSLVCDKALPSSMLGKELGQLKLEYTAEKGVFLAPKVYALKNAVNQDGKFVGDILKAKGLRNREGLTFESYEKILNLNNKHHSYQERWFRQIENETIIVKMLNNLMGVTTGKRVIVTDSDNKFITTSNIIFENGNIVTPLVQKEECKAITLYKPKAIVIHNPVVVSNFYVIHLTPTSLIVYSGWNPIVKYNPVNLAEQSVIHIPPLSLEVEVYKGGNPIVVFSREAILVDKQDIPEVIFLYPPNTRFDRRGKPIIKAKFLNRSSKFIKFLKSIRNKQV